MADRHTFAHARTHTRAHAPTLSLARITLTRTHVLWIVPTGAAGAVQPTLLMRDAMRCVSTPPRRLWNSTGEHFAYACLCVCVPRPIVICDKNAWACVCACAYTRWYENVWLHVWMLKICVRESHAGNDSLEEPYEHAHALARRHTHARSSAHCSSLKPSVRDLARNQHVICVHTHQVCITICTSVLLSTCVSVVFTRSLCVTYSIDNYWLAWMCYTLEFIRQ